MKSLKLAITASILILSSSANAAIVSSDWQISGDNLITLDTVSGLEWLDLTTTSNRTYTDISTKLGSGQEFDGWRYATNVEVGGFWDAFGGNSSYYTGRSTQNNGIFKDVSLFWGDLFCVEFNCATGNGYSSIFTAPGSGDVSTWPSFAFMGDEDYASYSATMDSFVLTSRSFSPNLKDPWYGSALVRGGSVVPVPAAIWLFGSGLLGLVGLARRKR